MIPLSRRVPFLRSVLVWAHLLALPFLFGFTRLSSGQTVDDSLAASSSAPVSVVQSAVLDPGRALFVPTHPRVTTTVRFPSAIGSPDGRGFIEDETKQAGEYLVSWSPGDPHFTLTPLKAAGPLNLNIPFRGSTYVLYFYPVERQFDAVASLILTMPEGPEAKTVKSINSPAPIAKAQLLARTDTAKSSPSRLLGLLDRLKLLCSTAPGDRLNHLASELGVEISIPQASPSNPASPASSSIESPKRGSLSVSDFGLFELRLQRVVRDPRLNALGFALSLRNKSKSALVFDPSSFGARTGARYLSQVISDAPALLQPGEVRDAYFVVQCPASSPLLANNAWLLSVELISPLLNPGATYVSEFARRAGEKTDR